MAEDKAEKVDTTYNLKKPNELDAYPKWVHTPTGKKYPDGSDVVDSVLVQNPEEHKALVSGGKEDKNKKPGWTT